MAPAEDALLLLRLVERHLGSLRGTLDPSTLADEDWGFLAQQTLVKLLKALLVLHGQEPPRSHSLQRLLQELASCGETPAVAPELLELDDFAVLPDAKRAQLDALQLWLQQQTPDPGDPQQPRLPPGAGGHRAPLPALSAGLASASKRANRR